MALSKMVVTWHSMHDSEWSLTHTWDLAIAFVVDFAVLGDGDDGNGGEVVVIVG